MKILVGVDLGTYAFDVASKQVTLQELSYITIEQVLLITNVTTNEIIYQFNKTGFGGTIELNTITLDYDTSLMNNSDNLQIFIEYSSTINPILSTFEQQYNQTDLLSLIYQELQEQTKLLKKIYQ